MCRAYVSHVCAARIAARIATTDRIVKGEPVFSRPDCPLPRPGQPGLLGRAGDLSPALPSRQGRRLFPRLFAPRMFPPGYRFSGPLVVPFEKVRVQLKVGLRELFHHAQTTRARSIVLERRCPTFPIVRTNFHKQIGHQNCVCGFVSICSRPPS